MVSVRYQSLALALVLLGGNLAAAPRPAAGAPLPTRAQLAGIFLLSDEPTVKRSSAIEASILDRLKALELEAPLPLRSSEPCKEASCLPQLADKAGAALAITGTVYRTAELCAANLWIYDSRTARERSAEIRCQPKTNEEVLAAEFAEQVGRMSERILVPVVETSQTPEPQENAPSVVVEKPSQRPAARVWRAVRPAVIPAVAASTAGLIGAAIMTTATYKAAYEAHLPWANDVEYSAAGLWVAASVSAIGLGVSIGILGRR